MEKSFLEIVVTLIAVLASLVSLVLAKEQKTSEFRQAWINALRDDVASFLGEIDRVFKEVIIHEGGSAKELDKAASSVIRQSVEMRRLQYKVSLLINPNEVKHIRLVELLDALVQDIQKARGGLAVMRTKSTGLNRIRASDETNTSSVNGIMRTKTEILKGIQASTALTQEILKTEWKRVKRGESFFYAFKWGLGLIFCILFILIMLYTCWHWSQH